MRIDKLLSNAGCGSRKEIKQFLKKGAVTVNGSIIKTADTEVDENKDEITFFGERVVYREFIYLMLSKPAGVVSATYDNRDATVINLVPDEYSHYELFPVGRLDKDTEGLLIITNDGALAHRLLSPKHHVPKTYYAETDGIITNEDIEKFKEGIVLNDGYKTLPAQLEPIDENSAYVTIHEGKFHQIKRMFADCGKKVTYLKRIKFGNIELDEFLEKGEIRELTAEEEKLLKDEI